MKERKEGSQNRSIFHKYKYNNDKNPKYLKLYRDKIENGINKFDGSLMTREVRCVGFYYYYCVWSREWGGGRKGKEIRLK